MTSPTWKQTTSPWKGPPPLGRNPYRPVQTVRRQPVAQPQNLETPATGLLRQRLGIIEGRIQTRMNGARWQRQITESFFRSQTTDEAFKSMLSLYMGHQKTNTPLHEWTLSP